jgi:hypothetical protein
VHCADAEVPKLTRLASSPVDFWRTGLLIYSDTGGIFDGPTESINRGNVSTPSLRRAPRGHP